MEKVAKEVAFKGYYLEPAQDLAHLWEDFFQSQGILLEHHLQWQNGFKKDDGYDFLLLDGEAFFKTEGGVDALQGSRIPVFILADYIDSELLRNCLTLGVSGCFDRSRPLKDILSEITVSLQDVGSRAYYGKDVGPNAITWLTWKEAKKKEKVSHLSELGSKRKNKLMEEVFIHEFFKAEGSLSVLSESFDGITRVTIKNYYNRFQKEIFKILITHFPDREAVSFLPLERNHFVQTMKKRWFYEDFIKFKRVFNNDFSILERVLKIPSDKIRVFSLYWDDLMV